MNFFVNLPFYIFKLIKKKLNTLKFYAYFTHVINIKIISTDNQNGELYVSIHYTYLFSFKFVWKESLVHLKSIFGIQFETK